MSYVQGLLPRDARDDVIVSWTSVGVRSGESVRITVWEVRRACSAFLSAKMEEVVLTVTRENCETLIGKNVRVIASDASKGVPKEVTWMGAPAEKIASDVCSALCFLRLLQELLLLQLCWDARKLHL